MNAVGLTSTTGSPEQDRICSEPMLLLLWAARWS